MNDDELVNMQIPAAQFRVLAACLVLGTLDRIADGTLGPEAGVWCFAIPRFRRIVRERGLLSEAFLEAMSVAGDLAALEECIPKAFSEALVQMRAAALAELRSSSGRDYVFAFPVNE